MIVPVSSLSRLTSEALTAAASLGDEVRAVTVCYPDPEDRAQTHALERSWAQWDPGVPLVRLSSERRSLGRPIAVYVREVAAAEPGTRVTVLIPETEPERLWLGVPPRERSSSVGGSCCKPAGRGRRARRTAGDGRGDPPAPLPAPVSPAASESRQGRGSRRKGAVNGRPIRSKRRFPLIVRYTEPHSRSSRWPIWPSSSPRSRRSRWWLSSPRG